MTVKMSDASRKLWNSWSHDVIVKNDTLLEPRSGSVFWSILPYKRKYCVICVSKLSSLLQRIKCEFSNSVYSPYHYVKEIKRSEAYELCKKDSCQATNLTKYRLGIKNPIRILLPAFSTILAAIIAIALRVFLGPYTTPVAFISVSVLYLTVGSLFA